SPTPSTRDAFGTRRRCLRTARCLSREGVLTVIATSPWPARSCTTRTQGPGASQAEPTHCANATRRRCYPTVVSWWPEAGGSFKILTPTSYMIRLKDHGALPTTSVIVLTTRLRYCPMAEFWSPEALDLLTPI